jgi:hypothetical protein
MPVVMMMIMMITVNCLLYCPLHWWADESRHLVLFFGSRGVAGLAVLIQRARAGLSNSKKGKKGLPFKKHSNCGFKNVETAKKENHRQSKNVCSSWLDGAREEERQSRKKESAFVACRTVLDTSTHRSINLEKALMPKVQRSSSSRSDSKNQGEDSSSVWA